MPDNTIPAVATGMSKCKSLLSDSMDEFNRAECLANAVFMASESSSIGKNESAAIAELVLALNDRLSTGLKLLGEAFDAE